MKLGSFNPTVWNIKSPAPATVRIKPTSYRIIRHRLYQCSTTAAQALWQLGEPLNHHQTHHKVISTVDTIKNCSKGLVGDDVALMESLITTILLNNHYELTSNHRYSKWKDYKIILVWAWPTTHQRLEVRVDRLGLVLNLRATNYRKLVYNLS